MTDAQKAMLRAYHRELSEEVFPDNLVAKDYEFWTGRNKAGDAAKAVAAIWNAHVARVNGDGSPAACDEALQAALRTDP